jgi:hypothetical protein
MPKGIDYRRDCRYHMHQKITRIAMKLRNNRKERPAIKSQEDYAVNGRVLISAPRKVGSPGE